MGFLKTLGIRQIVPTKFGKLKETFCRIKFGKLSFTFGKLGFDKLSLTRNIRRQCQLIFDLPGGTFKICNLNLSFFISWAILRVPLVAGTSSEGDGTTRQFRGFFYRGVFSLGLGGGVFCALFCFFYNFRYLPDRLF